MTTAPGPTFQQFNPFPSQEKPGYDILLSLSQNKLQNQLQTLYDAELPSTSLPPPQTPANNGPKKYLINHELRLLLPRTSKKNPQRVFNDSERRGILAHILCPEITLIPGKYRTVQLKFTFTSVPEASVQAPYSANSVLQELDEDNEIYPIPINGWSFSFEADLSTSKPMHIMNDILKLANDSTNPVTLPDKTKEQFQKLADITAKDNKVDSRTFLASSIFCLFQSTQIANSFKVTNDQGKRLSVEDFQTIETFSTTISTYFTTLNSSELPTAQNPFILGYAITQEIPKLSKVNTIATTDKTPKYFIPRRYDISVTPPPPGFGIPGALIFCLQTFRDDPKDEVDVDIVKTPNAGISYYTPQQNIAPNGRPNGHDGAMILSKRNFLDIFAVKTFSSSFWLNPSKILTSFGCTNTWDQNPENIILSDEKPRWEKAHTMKGEILESRNNTMQVAYRIPECAVKLIIECSSDWSNAVTSSKEGTMKTDSKREAYVTITTEAITTIVHKVQMRMESDGEGDFASLVNGIGSLITGAVTGGGDISDLPEIHRIVSTQRYKYVFKFAAGNAGAWDVNLAESLSTQPILKNNKTELDFTRVYDSDNSTGYGTFVQVTKGGLQGAIEGAFDLDSYSQNLATTDLKAGKGVVDDVLGKLGNISDNFKTTIMLPAGEVFMFTGMDTDKFGNLYCNVNYATPQGGKVVEKPLT